METNEEFRKTKELVMEALKDERCRNSDKWLILTIWQKLQQINVFIPYNKIDELISPETIRRTRQKIQNEDKLFLPTNQTVINRRKREKEIKSFISRY